MRKISEMYRISGGTSFQHICEKCVWFARVKAGKSFSYRCMRYEGADGENKEWMKTYPACAWFSENTPGNIAQSSKGEEIPQCEGQMSIEDYMRESLNA